MSIEFWLTSIWSQSIRQVGRETQNSSSHLNSIFTLSDTETDNETY